VVDIVDVKLLYGKEGKVVHFPEERTTVIRPKAREPLLNEKLAVREALDTPIGSPPLRDLVGRDDHVAIVFSDITRPMPYDKILPVLLEELSDIPDDHIVFINALGTHRPNTKAELIEILGPKIIKRFTVVQHDCWDKKGLTFLGNTPQGHEIWVNRAYMESSVRILTGFIEPHLFAGFSGGPKAVLPGIAGVKPIFANHGINMIDDPRSGFGQTQGNPIWEEMLEAALRTKPTFIVNVTQTEDRHITGIFAGDLQKAHEAGVAFARDTAMVPVKSRFDIVVTTSGGYPLDISMYQSVKGIAAAANIVKDRGTIILVSECAEGLPEFGDYGNIMRLAATPEDLLHTIHQPDFFMQDQWDAQIQARICSRIDLQIYSGILSDQEVRQVFGVPCHDIEKAIDLLLNKYGSESKVAVLPTGSLYIPYLQSETASAL
jgi:nickel-dependent lactate racemase